jgi:beta-glucosidase
MRTITFRIRPESLALYDRQMRRVVEPGTFTVYVGTNSDDVMTAHFTVTGEVLVLAPAPTRFR